jgi:lactose/L-arabinose transport system ATP-binding protein
VAIGRAIVRDPQVFLFDEPTSNLDAELRVQMRVELSKLHKMLGNTMIYVTHDQTEALTMADRIVVLRPDASSRSARRSIFTRTPMTHSWPVHRIAADELPVGNGPARRTPCGSGDRDRQPDPRGARASSVLQLGLRPEHLDDSAGPSLKASVDFVEMLGSTSYVHATLSTGETVIAERRSIPPRTGDRITLRLASASIRLFGAGGTRLR